MKTIEIIGFFTDLIKRFFKRTPKFFKIMRTIGIVLAFLFGLPQYLIDSGIDLPESIDNFVSEVWVYIGFAIWAVSNLAVDDDKRDLTLK